jgi:hypothetical protein
VACECNGNSTLNHPNEEHSSSLPLPLSLLFSSCWYHCTLCRSILITLIISPSLSDFEEEWWWEDDGEHWSQWQGTPCHSWSSPSSASCHAVNKITSVVMCVTRIYKELDQILVAEQALRIWGHLDSGKSRIQNPVSGSRTLHRGSMLLVVSQLVDWYLNSCNMFVLWQTVTKHHGTYPWVYLGYTLTLTQR